MRLLQRSNTGQFELTHDLVGDDIIHPYAILSHTWEEGQEVTFQDLRDGTRRHKTGYNKLEFCGRQIKRDDLQYFWVDTCCIDKTSSAEFAEAINSMFQWYHKARKCYVYLSDVSVGDSVKGDSQGHEQTWKSAFRQSRWFTRGWTLQELLASTSVEFFSAEGELLGDKISLMQEIFEITGIPIEALKGRSLTDYTVMERLSWAEGRKTKREEDGAYSLLGIFNVHMPLIYGEGRKSAFNRLYKAIEDLAKDDTLKIPLSMSSLKQPKRSYGFDSPRPFNNDPAITESFDTSSALSYCIDALERLVTSGEVETDLQRPVVQSEHEPGCHDGTSPIDVPHARRKDNDNPRPRNQGWETRFEGTRDGLNGWKHTRLTLRKDAESHDEWLARMSDLAGGKTREIDDVEVWRSIRDWLDGVSGRRLPSSEFPLLRKSTEPEYRSDDKILSRSGSSSIQRAFQYLLTIRHLQRLQAYNTFYDWLDIATLMDRHNFDQYYDKQVASRLEGTCEWIFSHPAFHAWSLGDSPDEGAKILWICAPGGYGKTIICTRLVQYFQDKQDFPVAHFFASPHAQSDREPSFIIRTWIAQIVRLDLNILDLLQAPSEAGQRASHSLLWSIFGLVASQNRRYTFILDGFDEYSRDDDVRTDFLQKLKKAIEGTDSRILISSREETDIKAELTPGLVQGTGPVILQCRISKEDVQDDLSRFSRSVVDKKLPKKDELLRYKLAEQLAGKSEGMFLWVKLQQDQLRGSKNAKQLQSIVQDMPIGLLKTYERNWKIIQSHSLDDQNRAFAILRWATFALRPLTVSEITEVLIVEPNENGVSLLLDELPDNVDDEYIDNEIIDICGALIEVRPGKSGDGVGSRIIHLTHPSVREFLLSMLSMLPPNTLATSEHSLVIKELSDQTEHQKYMATICLAYLNSEDIWKRFNEAQEGSEYQPVFLDYAARHWHAHMSAATKNDSEIVSLTNTFLRIDNESFLHWRSLIESPEVIPSDSQPNTRASATPLYYAALYDFPANMERIWAEDKSQLNAVGGEYGSPLQAACYKGHGLVFDLLIRWGADPNVEGGKFKVPIIAAIAAIQSYMVKALIRTGADISRQDDSGLAPLHHAVLVDDVDFVDMLIEAGAERNLKDIYGRTPLYLATDKSHLNMVRLLLEKGADVDAAAGGTWTPLKLATGNGQVKIVKLLVDKGANVNFANENGWTPLGSAADKGHTEIVEYLLESGADIDVGITAKGWTPLNLASDKGHREAVELLLKKGADVTAACNGGATPLYTAARGGYLEVVKLLIEKGAEIDARTDRWTPLDIALYNSHLGIAQHLLEKGAKINVSDSKGWTPLHFSLRYGHLELVYLLLGRGAKINVSDSYGWTPLHLVSRYGHLEIAYLLLERGAEINVSNSDGWTPLHLASRYGYLELIHLLLEKGAETEAVTSYRWMPLHLALGQGHVEVAQLLLEKGAGVNTSTDTGGTSLHLASSKGYLNLVELLLEKRANIAVVNEDDETPLYQALWNGHLQIVELLLRKGAVIDRTGGVYGSDINALISMGYVDLVRFSYEHACADPWLKDTHGRSPLQIAARSGHLAVYEYISSLNLDGTGQDEKGDSLIHHASSGGSLQIVEYVLDKHPTLETLLTGHWTPLHWACRAGNPHIVERLIKEGFRSEAISLSQPEGKWSPISIAIYCGNEKMLDELNESSRSLLGEVLDEERVSAVRHAVAWCDGCFHPLYGTFFHCNTCIDFDYCFMCKPFLEHLHKDHNLVEDECRLEVPAQ